MEQLGDCELLIDNTLVPDSSFKGMVIGEVGVGKSCVLHRVVNNEFKEDYDATIGARLRTLNSKFGIQQARKFQINNQSLL